nr:UDP-glucose:isoflavonoid glycosyltransferase [Micromonospora echinospora]
MREARIAIVNNFKPRRPGDSSHLSAALADRYVAGGHEALVQTAAHQDAPAEEERDGHRVVRLTATPMPQLGLSIDVDMALALARTANLRRVRRRLDGFQPEAIPQHGQVYNLTWLSGRYGRRNKRPVLPSVHTRVESPDPKNTALCKAPDRGLVTPSLRRHRPRDVSMDELCGADCEQRHRATPAEREHSPAAVEPRRREAPPTRDVRAEDGNGDQPRTVSLGHGTPQRHRRPPSEAQPTSPDKHPQTKGRTAGRSDHDAGAKRAAEQGGTDASATTGEAPPAAVPSCVAAADSVSQDPQGAGVGTASQEARAAGRATNGTSSETNRPAGELRNGENVARARPNDGPDLAEVVIRLLDDPQEREWIAKAQRELVHANFTLDVVLARRHLEAFARMTGAPLPQLDPPRPEERPA